MASFSRSLLRGARAHMPRSSLTLVAESRSSLTCYRHASTQSLKGAGNPSSVQSAGLGRWSLLVSAAVVGGTCLALSSMDAGAKLRMEAAPTEKRKSYAERMSTTERAKKEEKKGSRKASEPQATSSADKKEEENKSAQKPEKAGGDASEEAETLGLDDLSEEASQQSAFDPETNTINWDCPCLGGMAHGPCGEEFKNAFSCFVFSEAEPKGVDCVDKFQAMQDCFRRYPEHYKEELEDDEEYEQAGRQEDGKGNGKKGDQQREEEEDEGVREWRREVEKEGKA